MRNKSLRLLTTVLLFAALVFSAPLRANAQPVTKPDGTIFDAAYYAQTYPDVFAAFGNNETLLWNHFVNYGRAEGRRPSANATAQTQGAAFDAAYYAQTYPDVFAAFGNNPQALLQHYLTYGQKEMRRPSASSQPGAAVSGAGAAQTPQINYTGKTIAFIGDSITTFAGYIPAGYNAYYPQGNVTSVDQTWWRKLAAAKGMTVTVNASWSGSMVTGPANSGAPQTGCSNRRVADALSGGQPSVIVVYMGANDLFWSIPTGSYNAQTGPANPDSASNFAAAYHLLLTRLQAAAPASKIVCCTCLPTVDDSTGRQYVNASGYSIEAYNTVIRAVAAGHGCAVADVYNCGVTYDNWRQYTIDGIHPNADGSVLVANTVAAALR